jgi:hypothetical protein
MGSQQAEAFDQAARRILHSAYPRGMIKLQVVGSVIWGFPNRKGSGKS